VVKYVFLIVSGNKSQEKRQKKVNIKAYRNDEIKNKIIINNIKNKYNYVVSTFTTLTNCSF